MKVKIYQVNPMADTLGVKFLGLKEIRDALQSSIRSAQISSRIYDEVYSGDVDCHSLEDIYTLFNTNPPPFFKGHSLSVSDILQTDDGFFFCDRVGFEQVKFKPEKAHKPDNLLRVVALEPGKPAYEAEIVDDFRAFQQAVGGYFEVAYPFMDNAVLVANEEGLINGMEANRVIHDNLYVGPLFIIGDSDDGNFKSLTGKQVQQYLAEFQSPELFEQQDADEDMDSGMTGMNGM